MFCVFYKWFISDALDNGKALSPRLQRHIDRCPRCRHFYETMNQLGRALAAQAPQAVSSSRPASAERIFDLTGTAPRNFYGRYLAAAAVFAVASVAALHYYLSQSQPPETTYSDAVRAIDDIRSASRTIAGPVAEDPTPVVITYVAQKPLNAELTALTARTRSALRFMADCTPVPQTTPRPVSN